MEKNALETASSSVSRTASTVMLQGSRNTKYTSPNISPGSSISESKMRRPEKVFFRICTLPESKM